MTEQSDFVPSVSSDPAVPMASSLPFSMPFYPGAPWLPRYKGEAHTLRDFREKMLSLFQFYPLNTEQQIQILLGQLEGAAAREVKSWPASDKRTPEQILDKLQANFDVRSVSEVKMRFFSRRQLPGETLRDYALSLQEAFRAVVQVDPRENVDSDKILLDRFIEGAGTTLLQSQLRMLAAQHPSITFADFKALAIQVLGQEQPQPSPVICAPSPGPSTSIAPVVLPLPLGTSPAAQTAQTTPADSRDDLLARVDHLTRAMEQITVRLDRLTQPSSSSSDPLRSLNISPESPPRRPSSVKPPQSERPYCTYCHRYGHTRPQCFQLNGPPPRQRAAPREERRRAQVNLQCHCHASSQPAHTSQSG